MPIIPVSQPLQEPSSIIPIEHQEAIQSTLERPAVQTLIVYSRIPIPEKRLHARQTTLFAVAAERAAGAFLRQPREKTLLHFLLLPRVLGLGLQKGDLAATLRAFPGVIPPIEDLEDPKSPSQSTNEQTPAQRAIKLLEKGYLGRASKALIDPTPLAPDTPETLKTLYSKHPIGPQDPFSKTSPSPGPLIKEEAIRAAITSINKEKAPGLSGWTRPLIDIATSGPKSPVIAAIRLLADMIRQGTAPGAELLCASRLIALEKPNGGIRPIAIGDLIYRIALKAILTTTFRHPMLLPCQLGVNSIGGVEPAIFLLEEAITGPNKEGIKSIASLDLLNAFNAIGRTTIATAVSKYAPTFYRATKWAYNKPSLLVTASGDIIASAEGVRQGDPLAPLLFSLALRPTLEYLQKSLPTATLVAYLDDIYILGKEEGGLLAKAIQAFQGSPVQLNQEKSSEYPIAQLQKEGLKTLGAYIGPLEGRRAFLQNKINTLKGIISSLKDLPKQHALLLLQGSIHLLLRHLLRQLDPKGLNDLFQQIDSIIHGIVLGLAFRLGDPYPKKARYIIQLPIRNGGLGIPSYSALAPKLYPIAKTASGPLLSQIHPRVFLIGPKPSPKLAQEALTKQNEKIQAELFLLTSTSEEKSRLENSSYLGRQWLRVLPTQKQYQFADPEAKEALRSRLLLPCKPLNTPCTHCVNRVSIGHEDTCRAANRRWIQRHNQVTRAFIRTLSSREDLKVEEEPIVPLESLEPGSTSDLRTDFSVLLGTSRYYYDVQIVALNKDSAREDPFSTLKEAADAKRQKYRALGTFF
jgi:hypothetical protein